MNYIIGDNPEEDKIVAQIASKLGDDLTESLIQLKEEIIEKHVCMYFVKKGSDPTKTEELVSKMKRVHNRLRDRMGCDGRNPFE